MASGGDRYLISKLEGEENWMTWKVQLKHLLLDRELWGYVDGSQTLAGTTENAAREDFARKSQKALTAIMLSLTPKVVPVIHLCESPVEAWKALTEQFEQSTLASKLDLRKTYFRLDMGEETTVEQHVRQMKDLTDRLAAMGSPIPEQDQVMTLLASLPSSYSALVTTLGVQAEQLTLSIVGQLVTIVGQLDTSHNCSITKLS